VSPRKETVDAAATRARRGALSALEHAILGVLSVSGPCTAYAVRQEFARSPSSQWSGSAGAVYPALRRLERVGLVRSAALRGSARRARDYRMSAAGRAALERWLCSPVDAHEAAHVYDPVRLRVFFFHALAPEQRLAVIAEALARLEEARRRCEAHNAEEARRADRFGRWAAAGALRLLEARIAWFRELHDALRAELRR